MEPERLAGPYPLHVLPVVDLHFEVVLLSDPDGGTGRYALTFTERPELVEAWRRASGAQHWPYWDDTDPPADVPEAEWVLRRRTWERIVGWRAPARLGVTWTLRLDSLHFAMEIPPRVEQPVSRESVLDWMESNVEGDAGFDRDGWARRLVGPPVGAPQRSTELGRTSTGHEQEETP